MGSSNSRGRTKRLVKSVDVNSFEERRIVVKERPVRERNVHLMGLLEVEGRGGSYVIMGGVGLELGEVEDRREWVL